MSLFFSNWGVFSTLQVTLLNCRRVFVGNGANAVNPLIKFIFWLVRSEVRLTTLVEPEAFAIRNSDLFDQSADMAGSASPKS